MKPNPTSLFSQDIYLINCQNQFDYLLKEVYIIKEKYGLQWYYDLSNSYGIHLWSNMCRLKNIDFENTHENSLFRLLF